MVGDAVRAAIRIQEQTAELSREHPEWGLALGIGINVGDVVMGAMGSTDRMDYTVLGDNVNLAARLCSHAGADRILLSESAREAVEACPDFTTSALPPIAVKGKRAPVPVFEVWRRETMDIPS